MYSLFALSVREICYFVCRNSHKRVGSHWWCRFHCPYQHPALTPMLGSRNRSYRMHATRVVVSPWNWFPYPCRFHISVSASLVSVNLGNVSRTHPLRVAGFDGRASLCLSHMHTGNSTRGQARSAGTLTTVSAVNDRGRVSANWHPRSLSKSDGN